MKEASHKRPDSAWFHFYEISIISKSMANTDLLLPSVGDGAQGGKWAYIGTEFLFV